MADQPPKVAPEPSPGGGIITTTPEAVLADIAEINAELGHDAQGNPVGQVPGFTLSELKELRERADKVSRTAKSGHTTRLYRNLSQSFLELIGLLEDAEAAAED